MYLPAALSELTIDSGGHYFVYCTLISTDQGNCVCGADAKLVHQGKGFSNAYQL